MCGDCTKWLVLRTRRKIGLLALSPEMITNALFPTATWCHVFFFFFSFFGLRGVYIYSSCGEYLIYCPSISGVSWYLWNYNAAGVSTVYIPYVAIAWTMTTSKIDGEKGIETNKTKKYTAILMFCWLCVLDSFQIGGRKQVVLMLLCFGIMWRTFSVMVILGYINFSFFF